MITCPDKKCQGDSKVVNSRFSPWFQTKIRRRHCLACANRWSTVEITTEQLEELQGYQDLVLKFRGTKSCP